MASSAVVSGCRAPQRDGRRRQERQSGAIPLAGKVEPPSKGAYLGVYVPPAPFDVEAVDDFEKRVRKDVSIVMWYQPWAPDNRSVFDLGACVAVLRRGKVPLITWEPWDPGTNARALEDPEDQPAYRLSRIVNGEFDPYIRSWARAAKTLGGPVMLRPMHEMNGTWYPWAGTVNGNTPGQFVAAWKRIHDIFESEGATNVTWVWSVNHQSVPDKAGNRYADYYPGDDYVDWTAISGFNWGTTGVRTEWTPWAGWYTRPLRYLTTLDKPICIAEFGSVEQGGDKAAWLLDAYTRIRDYPDIKAVVYYDAIESGLGRTHDWRADSSASSLEAFREAISPGYYVHAPPAALTDWSDELSEANVRRLRSFRSVY